MGDAVRSSFKSKKEIAEILRHHDISLTSQRIEMAFLLLKKAQHLTAESVFKLVNTEFSKVSRATVYNNLNLFVEVGLLNELTIGPNMKIYDSNTSNHYHFADENGNLIDIDPEGIDGDKVMQQARAAMQKKYGKEFAIDHMQIVFQGKKSS